MLTRRCHDNSTVLDQRITLPVKNNMYTSFSYRLQCMQKPTSTYTNDTTMVEKLRMVKLMAFKTKNCVYELHRLVNMFKTWYNSLNRISVFVKSLLICLHSNILTTVATANLRTRLYRHNLHCYTVQFTVLYSLYFTVNIK